MSSSVVGKVYQLGPSKKRGIPCKNFGFPRIDKQALDIRIWLSQKEIAALTWN